MRFFDLKILHQSFSAIKPAVDVRSLCNSILKHISLTHDIILTDYEYYQHEYNGQRNGYKMWEKLYARRLKARAALEKMWANPKKRAVVEQAAAELLEESEARLKRAKTRAKPKAKPASFTPVLPSIAEETKPATPAAKPATAASTTDHFANFKKFAVQQNGKTPACKWMDPTNHTKEAFDPSYRNTGVPTGPINNLLVLDLDVKDDGVEEFKKYLAEHGNPNTLTVQTPSGGFHYYFNYASKNADDEVLIKTFLKNASKYRGKGIDIRSTGGYSVAPPSRRDGKDYKVLKSTAPTDIPSSLISWLIVGKPPVAPKAKEGSKRATTTTTRELTQKAYEYDVSTEQIRAMLAKLPAKYLDNYSDWLVVTSVLKCHDQYGLWETWSKQSEHYNEAKNQQQWCYNKGFLDINYLVWVLRQAGEDVEYVPRHKPYHPITRNIAHIKQETFHERYVSEGLSYETFEAHDTIIVKSCTGTGKTTAVAEHAAKSMQKGEKFLSITTRTSLSDQHQKSFASMGMKNYQDIRANFQDTGSLTICLNSLAKLGQLGEEDLKKYIVYIDEVSSFLEFTHNDTLDSILKDVFVLLSRLVKFARKVIVSDALINDNTFEFLKHRSPESTIMLTNTFQKFQNVPAVRLRSEREFLDKLVEHCNANKPFLFGSDSCDVVTKFYHRCISLLTDKTLRSKFVLITADTDVRIKNASEEFRDKFVFFQSEDHLWSRLLSRGAPGHVHLHPRKLHQSRWHVPASNPHPQHRHLVLPRRVRQPREPIR
jgi:hypothetical protein